jgi:hypothetical protein
MSQKRIQSTIQFEKPTTLTELYSFLGLVNYFRDHIPQHSAVAHSLHNMVSVANQQTSKKIVWTEQANGDFITLKSLVNQCPKLYFLDLELPIILYTDSSDYAHGAYLCQVQIQTDGSITEQPIRFLSCTFGEIRDILARTLRGNECHTHAYGLWTA